MYILFTCDRSYWVCCWSLAAIVLYNVRKNNTNTLLDGSTRDREWQSIFEPEEERKIRAASKISTHIR